ncbi:aspartate-semialdehyde dehydrogenase [Fusobacterium sp. IOR10]|uniref:aspartate-semialdehyde dehydrogenase n=1 Tax=Fusobacterium sp. IOR10 TaxID=2665157 RepID=UPI0013D5BF39|nr:aspartate-semialdehyde dehydrogenase [Fusobacterium sp. IOR10]
MKKYNVGILGATGAVGQEMIKLLEERNFPINEIRFFASARSVDKKIQFNGKEYKVEEAKKGVFKNIDILLGASPNELAIELIPSAIEQGCVVVDNSSAFRLDEDVPLVVPEVNPEAVKNHKGLIANPNCATIIGLVAINKLNAHHKIKRVIVSTYQAVSGAGAGGITELDEQVKNISQNKEVTPKVFSHQIAYNLIPQIGGFNDMGYSSEEMKFQNEGRKILENKELKVNCTCVRVPVYRSHSESITLEFHDDISIEEAEDILKNSPGVKYIKTENNGSLPMPLDTSDQDLVFVGRLRRDMSRDDNKGLSLWCCGDQIRKGAATNAIQIAELVIKNKN